MPEIEVGTKRANGDGEYGGDKKFKEDYSKIRILLKGNYSGALIGKGGENFKRLREEYGVKITGLSSRAQERVLQLDGKTNDCVSIIKELLPSCPEAPFLSQNNRLPVELNLLVNSDRVGSVIGKGGSKIKEICEKSGGKLKVYPDCLPNSNERVVSIGGSDEDLVISALDLVLSVVESTPARSQTVFFNPANPAPNPLSGPQGNHNDTAMLTQTTAVNNVNLASSVDIASLLMAGKDLKQRSPVDPAKDFGQVPTVTSLTVSNEMCGAIIGKAGMNIRQIRISSGAKIDFTQNEAGDKSDRTITITGTQDQIQIAEQLMSQIVRTSGPPQGVMR